MSIRIGIPSRILGAAGALLSLPAFAQGPDTFAEVESATPTYKQVQVAQPQQVCQNQAVTASGESPGQAIAGTLIGGAIGGLAGHAFGRGSGNTAMTALGAVGGAVAGNRIAADINQPTTTVQPVCSTYNNYYTQQQLTGYDVLYRYAGVTYHSHLPYNPGRTLQVRVAVTPVLAPPGYAPPVAPAPPPGGWAPAPQYPAPPPPGY